MTDMTTRISALRSEAGQWGDLAQVEICDRAIDGDTDAIADCQSVMDEAAAADDSEPELES